LLLVAISIPVTALAQYVPEPTRPNNTSVPLQCGAPPFVGPETGANMAAHCEQKVRPWCIAHGGRYWNCQCNTSGPNWRCNLNNSAAARPPEPESNAEPSGPSPSDVEAARRQLEAEQQRLRELEEQRKLEEEAQRRQRDFERSKNNALREMKGAPGSNTGLKGLDDGGDSGLKGLGDPDRTGLNAAARPARAANPQIASQISTIDRKLDQIVPPFPIPQKDVAFNWKRLLTSDEDFGINSADSYFAAWDAVGQLGKGATFSCKAILILGKSFIAGEDAAYVHLVKKDEVYEAALQYLKDPAKSRQFARLVQDIKENRPIPGSADPAMLKAARAITDPMLGSSGRRIAWDAMLSPEARAAMVRKAAVEIGMGWISDKLSDFAKDLSYQLTKQKATYDAVRVERDAAIRMLRANGSRLDPETRASIESSIGHANELLGNLYRLQNIGPSLIGDAVGEAYGKSDIAKRDKDSIEKLTTITFGLEPQAPEPK